MKKLFSLVMAISFLFISHVYGQSIHKGVVLEMMQVENYTYVRIKENSKDTWIAVPSIDVKVGDTIETSAGMVMRDFKSTTLKRTFPEIIFATKAYVTNSQDKSEVLSKSTDKVPGVFTISKLIDAAPSLNGKIVTFTGQVTKVNRKIMGKNWLHLKDDKLKDKNIDLVVTTNEENIKIDDILTFEGTVETNKDLGAGYFFKIIIENAKIVKKIVKNK